MPLPPSGESLIWHWFKLTVLGGLSFTVVAEAWRLNCGPNNRFWNGITLNFTKNTKTYGFIANRCMVTNVNNACKIDLKLWENIDQNRPPWVKLWIDFWLCYTDTSPKHFCAIYILSKCSYWSNNLKQAAFIYLQNADKINFFAESFGSSCALAHL